MELYAEALRLLAAAIISVLSGLALARFSKTRQERSDERVKMMVDTIEKMALTQKISASEVLEKIRLIDVMEKQIQDFKQEIRLKNKELRAERAHNALLIRQLVEEAKLIPVPRPVLTDSDPMVKGV